MVAVAELTRLLLPALRAANGHVVLINSGAGLRANAGWGAYAASKFALRAFGDALRLEEPALRVTSIHPGRIDTDMQRDIIRGRAASTTRTSSSRPARSRARYGPRSRRRATHTRPRSSCARSRGSARRCGRIR